MEAKVAASKDANEEKKEIIMNREVIENEVKRMASHLGLTM